MEKHELMKKHISICLASGKTKRQYCRENKLLYESFRHWRDKFAPESKGSRESSAHRILPVEIKEDILSETSEISISVQANHEIVIRIRKSL